MNFTTRRVQVLGACNRLLRYVHPQEAKRLIAEMSADRVDGKSIRIVGGLSSMPQDSRHSASSLKSTFIQRLESGRLIQHKRIEEQDRPIYQLAVTQNLSAARG